MLEKKLYSKMCTFADLKEGDMIEVQIMRVGKRQHPLYGEVRITTETMQEFFDHFYANVVGTDIVVDEDHANNHSARGWYRQLEIRGETMFAKIELTKKGAEMLSLGEYKYFSPEVAFVRKNTETGEVYNNVLIGGGFTNRPFFKRMEPLKFNETGSTKEDDTFYITSTVMKFTDMIQKTIDSGKCTPALFSEIKAEYEKMEEHDADLKVAYATFSEKFSELETPEDKKEEEKEGEKEETKKEGEGETPEDKKEEIPEDKKEEETKKEETPEDKKEETPNPDGEQKFSDPKTGATFSFSDVVAMQDKIKSYEFAERKRNIETTFDQYVFNETNQKGVILPKSKDAIVNFATSLSEQQLAQFNEIIKGLSQINPMMFKEQGKTGGDALAGLTPEEKINAKAKALMKDNKGMTYRQAYDAVTSED